MRQCQFLELLTDVTIARPNTHWNPPGAVAFVSSQVQEYVSISGVYLESCKTSPKNFQKPHVQPKKGYFRIRTIPSGCSGRDPSRRREPGSSHTEGFRTAGFARGTHWAIAGEGVDHQDSLAGHLRRRGEFKRQYFNPSKGFGSLWRGPLH